MVDQLKRWRFDDIVVLDGASTYEPMTNLLSDLAKEQCVTVVRLKENRGPRLAFMSAAAILPQIFCVTDPDVELNCDLPCDFLYALALLTLKHKIGKVGFALDISNPQELIQSYYVFGENKLRIWENEARYWRNKIDEFDGNPVYRAPIDTTFALYNRSFFRGDRFLAGLRVGGRFTAKHLPWYKNHQIPLDEFNFYRKTARSTVYTPKTIVRESGAVINPGEELSRTS
jgi:hypothetical protein